MHVTISVAAVKHFSMYGPGSAASMKGYKEAQQNEWTELCKDFRTDELILSKAA